MFYEDEPNDSPIKEACCAFLAITIGFIFCLVMAVLCYLTYQTVVGNMSYCTLWTDIPGRITLFLIFYYGAGICGTLPIPERFRMNCLPPFILYRLESWRNLFRNLYLVFACNYRPYSPLISDPEVSPVQNRSNEYNDSPISRAESEGIPIAKAVTPKRRFVRPKKSVADRDVEIGNNFKELTVSFDSSVGGCIVPMVKGKSTKPPYFPDSSLSATESSDKSIHVYAPTENLYEISETLNNRLKRVVLEPSAKTDTPPRTPDVELPVPSYPRFPWGYLRHRNGIPVEAKALHKRHLMEERRELDRQKKEQKVEEIPCSSKDSDRDWMTESDEINPLENRPLRLPVYDPPRRKTRHHSRSKSTPGNIRNLEKTKSHKRVTSNSSLHKNWPCTTAEISPGSKDYSENIEDKNEDKCCKNSPDLMSKAEQIQKTLNKLRSNLSGSDDGGEAKHSKENVESILIKTSVADVSRETSISRSNMEFIPNPNNISDEASDSRQNVGVIPSRLSDNSTDSFATLDQEKFF